MRKDSEFHDYVVHDLLSTDKRVTSRSMFGGYGLYHGGLIFGLIIENALYFKVDGSNIDEYEARKSKPFTYINKGKEVTMPYWEVPADVIDDRGLLWEWMSASMEITRKGNKR